MIHTHPLNLDSHQLAERCAQETQRYYRNQDFDEAYCYELIRRAILKQDMLAWDHVISQYRIQLESWVRRACTFTATQEDIEDLVAGAIARFWRSYKPELFGRSTCLADVLRYWQDCARCTVLDWQRRQRRLQGVQSLDDETQTLSLTTENDSNVENRVARQLTRQHLWRIVNSCCNDQTDREVAQRVFVAGDKPRHVFLEGAHKGWFVDQAEVYRRIRRLKDCLRHNQAFRELLENC
jgi:DNA-directed RNA polymerase specialized sigma24 family protein